MLRVPLVTLIALLALTWTASASAATTKVMTRNLYLGADVSVALKLLPDMPAAAQFMWDQVTATDFHRRAPQLAAEAARERPDVIGLQEATTWSCSTGFGGDRRVVFDFTKDFLAATARAGTPYVLASAGGTTARNAGFALGPIPFLTRIHDPATFQPLFGTDDADCGFQIGDALAVRADLAPRVLAAGIYDFPTETTLAPLILVVPRGYAWADIEVDGTPVRFVTTHLESVWTAGEIPSSARQAGELVATLESTTMPLVVMGDLNSDPRDPRDPGDNPGGQPQQSVACPAQSGDGDPRCSAYWTLRHAGYVDAGPDAMDPRNLTWGASALLAGPDPARIPAALRLGNPHGLTDRLDYAMLRNGARSVEAHLIGAAWPASDDLWACSTPDQIRDGVAAATALAVAVPRPMRCIPTDHAGVVATIALPASTALDPPLAARTSTRPLATTIV
ncbi:MAG: endonuclease/exonuclease/phosphatase family protein, partial [Gaiellales bacterium]